MPSSAIDQIKEKLNLVDEISLVVPLTRSGKAYKGLCPFHGERSPSFYVFPDTHTWRCFGCNEGGDIFTFVMKKQSLDFHEALVMLAEKANVSLGADDVPFEQSAHSQARARLRDLNEAAAIWFHHQLLTASSASYARSYLDSRGISNESIERFRLGFAPEGDGLARYLVEQGYSEEEIIEGGLARRRDADRGGSIYDYFRNRVIFTIRDGREQTIGFGARELGSGQPKYLNSPQTVLFDKSATLYAFDLAREAIRRQNEVVIVEGYVDAVIAHQYGYRNTVACIGSAITPKHVQQIKKITRHLVLALDPDAAGEAATLRAIEVAQESFDRVMVPIAMPAPEGSQPPRRGKRKNKDATPTGMVRFEEQVDAEIRVLQLPDGVDPDEFIRQDPPAWEVSLKAALPLIDFYFQTLLADLDLKSPTGQTEAGNRLFPVLATVGDRIKQDVYVRRLASLLRIEEKDAQIELQRYRKQYVAKMSRGQGDVPAPGLVPSGYAQEGGTPPAGRPSSPFSGRANAVKANEEYCLGLLVSNPEAFAEVYVILEPSDFWGTETRALYSLFASAGGPLTRALVDGLLAMQPTVLTTEAERLRILVESQPTLDRATLTRTAKQIAYRIKKARLSDAITEIHYLQREAAAQGDRETWRLLAQQGLHLTSQRQALDAAGVLQT